MSLQVLLNPAHIVALDLAEKAVAGVTQQTSYTLAARLLAGTASMIVIDVQPHPLRPRPAYRAATTLR
jgi:hypothetical protein